MRGLTGHYSVSKSGGEQVRAFVPAPLPPHPPLHWSPRLQDLSQGAMLALGRLDGLTGLLPDVSQFLYTYIRKEAVLSSQIEGTQSSLSDLLLFESSDTPGVPSADVVEVSNYVAALEHGIARLAGGFPLSLRLLREIHGVLLAKGRGAEKQPGAFRTSQNWIGGSRPGHARFVPPPPDDVPACMGALEKFLHDHHTVTPPLVKAALAHVQFETIHPFLDGNGRIGRLLVTLLLCHDRILGQPLLYLSLYLKQHRQTYYELLQRVRIEGAWEDWLEFFFTGVIEVAEQSAATTTRVLQLFREHQRAIAALGTAAPTAASLHTLLQRHPLLTVNRARELLGSKPAFSTINTAFARLIALGIVEEKTGAARGRVYAYQAYLRILSEGTELPA